MVYDPREDSYFLADFVKEHARGRVLDMCTGSGVQAYAALQNPAIRDIVAADIDPAAVERVRESRYPIRAIQSDLFASLEGEQFDTIVCNPPYLPDDRQPPDIALNGGPEGCELTVRFLEQAREHLAPNGQVLLLFSSFTNKERVDAALVRLGYGVAQLGELAFFFERLYVYRAWVVRCA
jgi:release factor glutamine methyltransferase